MSRHSPTAEALPPQGPSAPSTSLYAVISWRGGRVLTHRPHAARTRLLDLYAPHGSSDRP
ncbi:hypothetical protein [Streptomyces sp. NBC_00038]|uniref:hypothetical protein n=1 Tax=Streptomyces sp. NBC_00038 TaxID=2903615 RepID=UPI00224DF88D|nr:hypothetical protein [Streptomyces sp. NBC_00038]MCX5554643.1 hypothetical protein [Streptomyces sp. NBC_00038]